MTTPAPNQQLDDAEARRRIEAAKLLRRAHIRFRSAIADYRFARGDAERTLGKADARELVRLWMRRKEGEN